MQTAPRNLVFIINSLTSGGAEHALIELLEHLRNLLKSYVVHLVLLDVEEELHPVPNWVHKHVLDAKFSFFLSAISLIRLLRKLEPVVTISFLNRSNCVNVISSRVMRHPCIISERTHPSSRFGTGFNDLITRVVMRLTYPYADQVIAVSEGVKQDLIEHFDVDATKCQVIYNPINTESICQRALETAGIQAPEPFIVSAGRLVPSKNFLMLIEAYEASGINENLVILGEGQERGTLEQHVSRLGLEGRVHLPGHLRNPYPVIHAARLFVSSSNLEGFPNALIEAMALGCPIVATDCDTGPMEVLTGRSQGRCRDITLGPYGIVVPVKSIELLATAIRIGLSEDNRALYSQRSKQRAQDFGSQRAVNQYWSVINEFALPH